MYLWALSKIVGTKLSVGSPFSSLESGGYQDSASTPKWQSQKPKKKETRTKMTTSILKKAENS